VIMCNDLCSYSYLRGKAFPCHVMTITLGHQSSEISMFPPCLHVQFLGRVTVCLLACLLPPTCFPLTRPCFPFLPFPMLSLATLDLCLHVLDRSRCRKDPELTSKFKDDLLNDGMSVVSRIAMAREKVTHTHKTRKLECFRILIILKLVEHVQNAPALAVASGGLALFGWAGGFCERPTLLQI